jgi:hypothetical protein
MNENSWENVPEDVSTWFGFVYRITCISNGKKYIGKKQFWSNQKRPPLKGQKRSRRVTKESDWKKYYGSSNDLKEDLQKYGKENFKREILELTTCKWESAYLELMWQLKENAILREDYYNGIINIRLNGPPKDLVEKYRVKSDEPKISESDFIEYKKCENDLIYFIENYVKFNTLNGFDKITLYDKQKEILKSWAENKRNVTLAGRQSGLSTLHLLFSLHNALFKKDHINVILTMNEACAEYSMEHLLKMYNSIPFNDIKPQLVELSENIIKLSNGSKIFIAAENLDYIKGRNVDNIIVDNIDYFTDTISDEILKHTNVIVRSRNTNKIIISGTKKPKYSLIEKLYNDLSFSRTKIVWTDIPSFDENWKNKMLEIMSLEEFENELECK